MNQKDILKLAGVKTEKELYSKYRTHEEFLAKFGAEIQKAEFGLDQLAPYADVPGKLVQGFQQLGAEKKKRKSLESWANASDVVRQAAGLQPEQEERQYVRPEDIINTGEEFFPIYGVGTNVLAKDGKTLKKAFNGDWLKNTEFGKFTDAGGMDKLSSLLTTVGGENAGGDIGGTLGQTAGSIIGGPIGGAIGKIGGQVIGGLIDRNPHKIKEAQDKINKNIQAIGMGQGVQQQYSSFMRTGGQLKQNTMNGDLKVYDGEAEQISYNPYSESETVMFRGSSHEDGGMPITYGNSPVEVEGGEPAVKMNNGGEQDSLVVFGNLQIPKNMLQDKNANGKKFKNYISDLSKIENKQNKIMEKSTKLLEDTTDNTSFDKLKLTSLKANLLGSNMMLKDISEKKKDAAALQSAINDTAEEHNIVADDLARGSIKQAKNGLKTVPKIKYKEDPSLNSLNEKLALKDESTGEEKKSFPWMEAINSVVPYLRPSDAESLDPRQLTGEMYSLSNNQLEPVYAQTLQPELSTPYNISYQDVLNENRADFRSTQRMVGNNPAALAMLNAQKYGANQKVLGEQFRQNQAEQQGVYNKNRDVVNQAKLQNMNILAQQQDKQAIAKSNTKAITQKALESISNKYLQNQLENRTLQTYENMYNYRYDDKGRLINMNPLQQWNTSGDNQTPPLSSGYEDIYRKVDGEYERIDTKKKPVPRKTQNGGLVRAFK